MYARHVGYKVRSQPVDDHEDDASERGVRVPHTCRCHARQLWSTGKETRRKDPQREQSNNTVKQWW